MNCDFNNTYDDDNDVEVLFSVGRRFLTGNGIEQDVEKGRAMLMEAASMGHPLAKQFLDQYDHPAPVVEEPKAEVKREVCPHNASIDCPCTKECPRHGRCCQCVAHHRSMGNLPKCLRDMESK